ncbi:hypothetical protein [Mesorhizobium sp.]|uniref:hypothetical protein n=1 Tax=Mesorhizobium sp. TaxID=1871066 RepID=UPI0025ECEBC3|nr:hypothetical protein [Mesorhizobium sp.]
MTSGEFGFEREVVEKATLDRIPLPDFRVFEQARREEVLKLFDGLISGDVSWDDVDLWVARLYGLGPRDLQVISDTLEFNLPFAQSKRDAQKAPELQEQAHFCEALEKELKPWCDRWGSKLTVRPINKSVQSPWYGIDVRTSTRQDANAIAPADWDGLLRIADDAAASEIVIRDGQDGLLIGRLAQRRYWSETQARLLAQRIVWSHVDLLKGRATA